MARRFSRNKHLAALVLGSVAISVAMPTVAFAGSSQHRNHREWRGGDRDRHGDSHRGDRHRTSRRHSGRDDRRYSGNDRNRSHRDRRSYARGSHRNNSHDNRHHSRQNYRNHNRRQYSHSYYYDNYPNYRNSTYYCAACDHGFGNRNSFNAHLSGHHGIALWELPFVIIQSAIGWIFHG